MTHSNYHSGETISKSVKKARTKLRWPDIKREPVCTRLTGSFATFKVKVAFISRFVANADEVRDMFLDYLLGDDVDKSGKNQFCI